MISTEASLRGDLLGELDHARHGLVAVDQFAPVVGDGRQHGGDQLGVGRQRDVFLGAGLDGRDRGARIGGDAAGDDRRHGCARLRGSSTRSRISSATSTISRSAPRPERSTASACVDVCGMGDLRALVHRDLGRGGELAVQACRRSEGASCYSFFATDLSAHHESARP